jgi:pilus assembly protein CpaF
MADFGPLEALLKDPTVIEIMVNGYQKIFVSRQAFMIDDADAQFDGPEHLWQVATEIAALAGIRLDAAHPIVDARLPDGSQVHIVVPPLAPDGPVMTLRKSGEYIPMPDWETLLRVGSINEPLLELLRWCVNAHLNIVVSGGAGSGKTTFLNMLMNEIREGQRLIVVQKTPDLQLLQYKNLVRLESRAPNVDGTGGVSVAQLIESAMKMRPTRLICPDVPGDAMANMIDAMSNGVDGSMFAIHANNPRDALQRIEMQYVSSSPAMPLLSIRHQLANAINVIIQFEILQDGWRRLTRVSEVRPVKNGEIELTDIFEWVQTGRKEDGTLVGYLTPTGVVPQFMQGPIKVFRMVRLPDEFFVPVQP